MTDSAAPVLADDTDEPQAVDASAELSPAEPSVGEPSDAAADVPRVVLPDRADAPVSEITERFLRAIIAQVPLDRIEELHLFSPLRQGGVETGIAVIAARVPAPVPVEEPAPQLALDDQPVAAADEPVANETVEVDAGDSVDAVDSVDAIEAELAEITTDTDVVSTDDADDAVVSAEDSPYLDEVESEAELASEVTITAEDAPTSAQTSAPANAPANAPIERHTVYTARYRLVQKGPERGKWESDVTAEADAPLITVETVVRGVQRRAGEESEILRYSARQIARALRLEWPLRPIDDAPQA